MLAQVDFNLMHSRHKNTAIEALDRIRAYFPGKKFYLVQAEVVLRDVVT